MAHVSKFGRFTFYFRDEEDGPVVATESVVVECPGPESTQEDMIAVKLATEVAVKFERQRRKAIGSTVDFFIKAGPPAASLVNPGFDPASADDQRGKQYAWRVHPDDFAKRRS